MPASQWRTLRNDKESTKPRSLRHCNDEPSMWLRIDPRTAGSSSLRGLPARMRKYFAYCGKPKQSGNTEEWRSTNVPFDSLRLNLQRKFNSSDEVKFPPTLLSIKVSAGMHNHYFLTFYYLPFSLLIFFDLLIFFNDSLYTCTRPGHYQQS